MAVRVHVAWHWRGLILVVALALAVGLVWWWPGMGGIESGELARLRERIRALETDNEQLRLERIKAERQTQIESAAQLDTERAVKTLQNENATLKEELVFMRGMMSGDRAGVSVYRFKVERESAGVYRYQLLVVQAGQREKPFQGHYQLVVTGQEGARKTVLTIPANDPATAEKFRFNLTAYQNLEGSFRVPANLVVKNVEARIFGEGSAQIRSSKAANLS